jgi:ribbon-helix-helix CopG family protein
MTSTLTCRVDAELLEALRWEAALQNKTVSELVREILQQAVVKKSVGERVGHLRGRLTLTSETADPWRQQLRERNWRRDDDP